MSVNSSSSFSSSLHPSNSPPVHSYSLLFTCFNSTDGRFTMITFTVASTLLFLPLCVLVIYLGLQRRQQQSSRATSHSDVFTYNMVAVELTGIFGSTLSCCGVLTELPVLLIAGIYLFIFCQHGEILFHTLTCVERYLAVIHPIIYVDLRRAKWVRIRNGTIGCGWLLSVAEAGLSLIDSPTVIIIYVIGVVLCLAVVSFCSLSVLRALIRPGPGEEGEGRERLSRLKLRAVYTIMAILGVLLIKNAGTMFTISLYSSSQLEQNEQCQAFMSVCWFGLPSNLVLPLLFLHRTGKVMLCKSRNKEGSN